LRAMRRAVTATTHPRIGFFKVLPNCQRSSLGRLRLAPEELAAAPFVQQFRHGSSKNDSPISKLPNEFIVPWERDNDQSREVSARCQAFLVENWGRPHFTEPESPARPRLNSAPASIRL